MHSTVGRLWFLSFCRLDSVPVDSFGRASGWTDLCLCVGVLGHRTRLRCWMQKLRRRSQKHTEFAPTCRARELPLFPMLADTSGRSGVFLSARCLGSRIATVALMCGFLMTDEAEPLHVLVWIAACVKCLFSHGWPSPPSPESLDGQALLI